MLDVEWERCKVSSGTASAKVAAAKPFAPPIALSLTPKMPLSVLTSAVVPVSVPELV